MSDASSPPGVIDTIGNGFAVVIEKPFLTMPLVALDLFLLFGPRVTMAPIAARLSSALEARGAAWREVARESARLENVNIFDLAVIRLPLLRLPAIVPSLPQEERLMHNWSDSVSMTPLFVLLLATIAVVVTGLLYTSAFLSLAAAMARPAEPLRSTLRAGRVARLALRFVGWALTMIGLFLLIAMPILVLTFFAVAGGLSEVALLWLLLLLPLAWGFIHFYFSIQALVINGDGLFDALRSSYRIVRAHFWQSVQFIAVSALITTGVPYALRQLATNTPGIVLAIVVNAFIASGIIVAAILFYCDRASSIGLSVAAPGR